jgi:hypothetical protein
MANDDNTTNNHPSPDDALEPPDDIFNPAVDEERLEEDYDPPATPAKPHLTTPKLPPNHPATDSEIDFQELYDEGLTSATDYDAQDEAADNDQPRPLEPEEDEGRDTA